MLKNKKIFVLIMVSAITLAAVVSYFLISYYFPNRNIMKVNVKGDIFMTEVVDSAIEMQKGLGGRDDICSRCGMLFKFEKEGRHAFWMRGMRFPLDIVWIMNGRVVHVEKSVDPDFDSTLFPDENANFVLELKAGNVDRLGLIVGDGVSF